MSQSDRCWPKGLFMLASTSFRGEGDYPALPPALPLVPWQELYHRFLSAEFRLLAPHRTIVGGKGVRE